MSPGREPSSPGDRLPPQAFLLAYTGALALTAGFVNAVALLVLAFPVGNVTAVTTQLGMNTANSLLYEGNVLAAILLGFLAGATAAGSILAPTRAMAGPRHASVLAIEGALLFLAAFSVEERTINGVIAAVGIESTAIQATLAATALGMQNALTSNFREMAIRTTHFTGTVTDLGLLLGRSRRHGIDRFKAAVLSVTLLLFLAGGIAGLVMGAELGGYALILPASLCVAFAAANVVQHRRVVNAAS